MQNPNTRTKEIVLEYVDNVWNQCDINAFLDLTTSDFMYHIGSQPPKDRNEMKLFLLMTHKAFPDWRVHIIDIFSENQKVVIRWDGNVTHDGEFYNIAPTGKLISVSGINIYYIKNEKISLEWEQTDTVGIFSQLNSK